MSGMIGSTVPRDARQSREGGIETAQSTLVIFANRSEHSFGSVVNARDTGLSLLRGFEGLFGRLTLQRGQR